MMPELRGPAGAGPGATRCGLNLCKEANLAEQNDNPAPDVSGTGRDLLKIHHQQASTSSPISAELRPPSGGPELDRERGGRSGAGRSPPGAGEQRSGGAAFMTADTEHRPQPMVGPDSRRLMAVVFVDAVGFSSQIEQDEAGAHAQWSLVKRQVIEPEVQAKGGRIIKSTGDGYLFEFPSAVAGVQFALDAQAGMRSLAEQGRVTLTLRASVHIGDVIDNRDDLFGDSVNIAARLQEYADPGGVILSSAVHEQVQRRIPYEAAEIGFLQLKNIERPVRALKIAPAGRAEAAPARASAGTHRPAIAVLPFRVLGSDADLRYISEGTVHSIVASLAGLRELFVISSSTTVTLQDSPAELAATARRFGARYLLTGAMARDGSKLQIRVELSDAETSVALWTDRYRLETQDIFDFQDEIAIKVAHSLVPLLRQSELRRALRKHPDSLDAYDLLIQALYRLYRFEDDDFQSARRLLEQAVERDPDYALPYAFLAKWHILAFGQGYSSDVRTNSTEAARFAQLALQKDPSDPLALTLYGHTLAFLFGRCDEAIELFEHATASCPNSAIAWGLSAPTYCYIGDTGSAIDRARHALALSPLDPCSNFYKTALTLANYFNGDHETAIRWGRKTFASAPRFTANMRPLIGSLIATGQTDEARQVAAAMMALEPRFRISTFRALYPVRDEGVLTTLCDRLRAAGVPD